MANDEISESKSHGPRQVNAQEAQESKTGHHDSTDPQPWSSLPNELLWCILQYAPVDSLMRWRRVAKEWRYPYKPGHILNGITTSPPLGEAVPLLLTSKLYNMQRLNVRLRKWEDLPCCMSKRLKRLNTKQFLSGGGLIVIVLRLISRHEIASVIVVSNPITGLRKRLPSIRQGSVTPLGVVSSADRKHYAVVLKSSCDWGTGAQLSVYRSESRTWQNGIVVPEKFVRSSPYSCVSVGAVVYFLTRTPRSSRLKFMNEPMQMGAYNTRSGEWLEVGNLPDHAGSGRPYLVENAGDVLFVARATWVEKRIRYTTWKFYRLNKLGLQLEEEGTEGRHMPSQVYQDLILKVHSDSVMISGGGNQVYFYGRGLWQPSSTRINYLLMAYNTKTRTWEWLPNVIINRPSPGQLDDSFVLPFQPSLMPVRSRSPRPQDP